MKFELRNSVTFTSCEEIQGICQDFFNLTGISYFNFVRVYDDGSRFKLSNDRAWLEFIFENHQKYSFAFEETTENLQSRYLVWDLIDNAHDDELIKIAREKFNIDHGFTLINRCDNFTEFCYFATTPGNKNLNLFYISNIDIIQSFLLYFKDKADKLITSGKNQRFDLKGHLLADIKNYFNKEALVKNFFKHCNAKRFFLSGQLANVHLTTREAECLTYLFDGKVPKEIAKLLGISYRTIEGYIEAARIKMHCNTKSELIETAKKCGFEAIYGSIKAKEKRRYGSLELTTLD